MERIDVLADYLEMRKTAPGDISMESIYTTALKKLREWLRASGSSKAIQLLKRQPWQEEEFHKFILYDMATADAPRRLHFNDKWSIINTQDAGWFTIGGKSITHRDREALLKAFNDEIAEYNEMLTVYYPICIRYLDWALNATQSILLTQHGHTSSDYDFLSNDRPLTVAEAMDNVSRYWIGMRSPLLLTVTKKFGESELCIVDIPVKPPRTGAVPVPGILPKEISEFAKCYRRYDEFNGRVNDMFKEFDKRISRLKTYREITSIDEEYHRILTDVDQEMMLYFNVELFSALFSRAGSLQYSLAHFIYNAHIPE